MNALHAKRHSLNPTRLGAILIVAASLHLTALGQVARDVQTSTVTSGTVLDAEATVNARRNAVLMTIRASISDVNLVKGQDIARFHRWGIHVENGAAMLAMFVAADKPRRVKKIVIPNMGAAAGRPSPDKEIRKLAGAMRIGDTVRFNYLLFGDNSYLTDMSLAKDPPAGNACKPFVYTGSKLVRRSGGRRVMTVTAKAGDIPCTFTVPQETDLNGRSRPLAKVADALKSFIRGDLLELEYKTVGYEFVLTGVKPAECVDHGVIRVISHTRRNGYKHMVAAIRTPKRIIRLIDPEAIIELNLRGAPSASPDPQVQTTLKTLRPKDFVMFKYSRQRGVCRLDGIYPASRSPALAPAPGEAKK